MMAVGDDGGRGSQDDAGQIGKLPRGSRQGNFLTVDIARKRDALPAFDGHGKKAFGETFPAVKNVGFTVLHNDGKSGNGPCIAKDAAEIHEPPAREIKREPCNGNAGGSIERFRSSDIARRDVHREPGNPSIELPEPSAAPPGARRKYLAK